MGDRGLGAGEPLPGALGVERLGGVGLGVFWPECWWSGGSAGGASRLELPFMMLIMCSSGARWALRNFLGVDGHGLVLASGCRWQREGFAGVAKLGGLVLELGCFVEVADAP